MFTMWGKTSPWFLQLVACLAVVGHTVASSEHVSCMLGADGTNDALASCLQKGDDFLRAYYTKRIKGGKDDFETCGNYEEFRSCITPLLAQCDSVRYSLEDSWLPIVSLFSCACNDTKRCQESLRCFEEESNDLLVERCDALYKFNLRQHTRDKCYFLQQNVKCKEVLVRTGCGAQAGLFAFHVAKMFRRKKLEKMEMNKMSCPVSRDIHYDDFEYTEACPRSFKEKLSTCEDLFITDSRLVFYEDNELVADARNKGVKKACRGFREYRRCVRPIKDTCPLGTDVIYEYDSELRTYLMKLDFICRMARTDYLSNLQCYQDVLYNRTLMSCNPIWEDLEPWLNQVTSYSFYCQRQDGDTKMLQRKIDKLRVCYTDVFKTKCGDNAGDVIGQLIAKAFQDPFYLRMQYRPHCSRHKRPKIPVARATNEQLITKTFGGSFVEENSAGVETTTRTYKREAVRTRSDTSSSARMGSTTAHASVALLCLLVVVRLW